MRLFGLDAAPLGTARVLELGCASGGNIISLPRGMRLEEEVLAGRLTFTRDGNPITGADAIAEMVAERVSALVAGLANVGLIES